jgi:hypothetical protein
VKGFIPASDSVVLQAEIGFFSLDLFMMVDLLGLDIGQRQSKRGDRG